MTKRALRWILPTLALLAPGALPAHAGVPAAQPAPLPAVAQAPAPDDTGCGLAFALAPLGDEANAAVTPAVPPQVPEPIFLKPPPPFKLRTCVCSCGYPCETDADCGPGGNCGPGITCC